MTSRTYFSKEKLARRALEYLNSDQFSAATFFHLSPPASLELTRRLGSVMPRHRFGPPTTTLQAQFATYCLLSLIVVAIFQCKPSGDANALVTLIWGNTPFIVSAVFHTMNNIRYMKAWLPLQYIVILSMTLLGLGQVATWIPTYLAVECGTDAQARAIHFALSYVVLSEWEFYRLCWETHHGNRPFNLKSLLAASNDALDDPDFRERRDFLGYCIPEPPVPRPEDGWMFTRRFINFMLPSIQMWGFHLTSGCLNHLVKRLANRDPHGDDFPLFFKGFYQVFFTPRYRIFHVLDLLFQRPIRVLNGMMFWFVKRWVERAWNVWYNRR